MSFSQAAVFSMFFFVKWQSNLEPGSFTVKQKEQRSDIWIQHLPKVDVTVLEHV